MNNLSLQFTPDSYEKHNIDCLTIFLYVGIICFIMMYTAHIHNNLLWKLS